MIIILNEAERKPLAALIGQYEGCKPQYLRAPSYGYQIGRLLLTREGNIEGPDTLTQEEIKELLILLDAGGYRPEETEFHPVEEPGAEDDSDEKEETLEELSEEPLENTGLTITLSRDSVNVENLRNLLEAKKELIKHALHIEDLSFELGKDKISFPWFSEISNPDEGHAYTAFLAAMCKMSKEQKRISSIEKPVDNEKYAFRCFLLRLGFIGDEYKMDRKILLRNLPGNSAFKGGKDHAITE